jgi:glutathione synthase
MDEWQKWFALCRIHHNLYVLEPMPPDVIHAVSKFHVTSEPRHLYFFREGSVVGWNMTDLEVNTLMSFLSEHEIGPYNDDIVQNEKEIMFYTYTEDK